MTNRSKGLALLISLGVIASLMLAGLTGSARAAGNAKTHSTAFNPQTCKGKHVKAKGTIKYSDWQFPDSLNPYQTTAAVSVETLNGMFDSLFLFNNKAKLITQMVTTMPTLKNGGIKNGGKLITLHLKKGMHWSDGAETTSKDIKFGWGVGMDKDTGPACSGSCDVISRIDTPDKYTAVLHLKKVYAPVLSNGMPPVWPTKWAGAWSNDTHAAANKLGQDSTFNFEGPNFPTNGPYQVKEFVNNDRIVLTPMKYYTGTSCGAQVSQMIFAFYSSKPALIAAAASKQTDVTQDYTVADLPELKKHTDTYHLHADPGFIFEHLELNTDKTYNAQTNPLSNTNVRLALALSLDKLGLIQSALGVPASQAKQVIAWTFLVNTPNLVQPFADKKLLGQWDPLQKKYDPNTGRGKALADAKKLLDKTPFKGGFSLDFFTTSGNPVRAAQEAVVAASWAKIGVKVNPNFIPSSKLFADWDHGGVLDHGAFQVGQFAYLGSPDPDSFKYNQQSKYVDRRASVHATINSNNAGISNATINKAYDAAAHTLNNSIRAKNYSIIQRTVNQNAYWIPLYFRPTIATDDGHVANFFNNPTSTGPTWNMYAWKVKA